MISNSRIVILAALPRELARITKGWRTQRLTVGPRELMFAWSDTAVAIAGGMGTANATRALEAAHALTPVRAVLTVGFAGALKPALLPGTLLRPSFVVDAATGERFSLDEGDASIAVTSPAVADAAQKKKFELEYHADLVEMEAAAVARMCNKNGVRCLAFKAISDDADFSLPELGNFSTPDGRFRSAAFAAHVALRPALWRRAGQLGSGAAKAQAALAEAIQGWLAEDSQKQLSLR
jgi:nucleoside phosphorylase